ncbi:MAG: hypothetical protein ACXVCY_04260 [Pseudobdellovibrionaceae bacterium]
MSKTINTNKIAQEKAQKALRLIEQAQNCLSQACGELSPLVLAAEQWKATSDQHDAVKNLWHKVNNSISWNQIDLDSDAKAKLQNKP